MPLKQLLTGKATGGPFFLAWVLSIICYILLRKMIFQVNIAAAIPFEALRIIGIPMLQATLLLSSWWRRTIWVLTFLLLALYNPIFGRPQWDALMVAPILLTPLLIGERRRVWIWAIFALYCTFLPIEWWGIFIALYRLGFSMVADFVPSIFRLSRTDFLAAMISTIFAFIAAYLMPPKTNSAQPPSPPETSD